MFVFLFNARSCGKRCAWWFAKLVVVFVLFAVFTFIVIQHSVIDRDFVVEQIHRNLKRFEVKLYGQEPAVWQQQNLILKSF